MTSLVALARYIAISLAVYLQLDAWLISSLQPQYSILSRVQEWLPGSQATYKLVLLAVLAIPPVVFIAKKRLSFAQQLIGIGFVVYFAGCVGSILSAKEDILTASSACSIALALLLGMNCIVLIRDSKAAIRILGWVTALLAIATILLFNSPNNVTWSGTLARAGGPFQRPEIVGTLLVVALPSMLTFTYNDSVKNPLSQVVVLAVSGAALTMTWMRDSFAALGVSFAILVDRDQRRNLIVPISVVFTLLTLVTLGVRSSGEARRTSSQKSTAGHIQAWEEGLKIFAQRPIRGVGVSAVSINVNQPGNLAGRQVQTLSEPKSIYIALLDDLGIAGAAILVALFYGLMKHFRSARDSLSNQLLASWIAIALLGVFDTVVFSDRFAPNMLLGILVGLTLMPTNSDPPISESAIGAIEIAPMKEVVEV